MAGVPPAAGTDRDERSRPGAPDQSSTLTGQGLVQSRRLPGAAVLGPTAMAAFRGIAVRLAADDAFGESFELVLVHATPERSLVVGVFDADEIIASWRAFAATSGLPLLLERSDGTLEAAYDQMGRVRLGQIRIRRRHGLLNGRRPRFLVRRKTARLPDRPVMVRGREMLGRD